MRPTLLKCVLLALGAALVPSLAQAELAQPWEVWLLPPASPVAQQLHSFMGLLQWVITAITLFVLVLIAYTCWRFHESRNPVPSRRSHNTVLEIAWTAVPVLILVIIAIPSFKLLYYVDVVPETQMTLKAIGRQWYWSLRVSGPGQLHLRRQHGGRERPAAGPAPPARDRQPRGPADRHQHPSADHRQRRRACLEHASVRHQARRLARPPERGLVPDRRARDLLRPVLGAVRRQPRLHADQDRGRAAGRSSRPGSRRRSRNSPVSASRPSRSRPTALQQN